MKTNKIIFYGPSGCGKSAMIRVLQHALESRGYAGNRIEFVERRGRGMPSIQFEHPQGMNDLFNLFHKCAGEEVDT